MAWREAQDVAKERLLVRNVAQVEEQVKRILVQLTPHTGKRQQRLDLRAENELAGDLRVMQRFDADRIAPEQQALSSTVPDRKGEDAIEVLRKGLALLFVEVDEDFGIGLCAEYVAAPFEIGTQLGGVVDLAVVDDPDRLIFIGDGLIPTSHIDDPQSAAAEIDAGLRAKTFGIRP